jgi:hypothetical protein
MSNATVTVRGHDASHNTLVADSVAIEGVDIRIPEAATAQRGLASKLMTGEGDLQTWLISGEMESEGSTNFESSERFFCRRAENDSYFRIGHGYWSSTDSFQPASTNKGYASWMGGAEYPEANYPAEHWIGPQPEYFPDGVSDPPAFGTPTWTDSPLSNGVDRIDFREDANGWLQWKFSGSNVDFGWYDCWARPESYNITNPTHSQWNLGVTPNHLGLELPKSRRTFEGETSPDGDWVHPHTILDDGLKQNVYLSYYSHYYLKLTQPRWMNPSKMLYEGYYAPGKIAGFHLMELAPGNHGVWYRNQSQPFMAGELPYRFYK